MRQAVEEGAARLEESGVAFGQGTTDALQESMWLAAHVLAKPWDALVSALDAPIAAARARALEALVVKRIATRKPAAYLLNEAWLGPYRFYVDERVIVPRSFIAEMMLGDWIPGDRSVAAPGARILDLCTGSGCLAILAALQWPGARVDAADISKDALEVARRNVNDHGVDVQLFESDLFTALGTRTYDLILSNPPYVKAASMKKLPDEFRKEPQGALASGADGLDHTRAILAQAKRHLRPGGMLVVEIGHNRKALERAYPDLPFKWPRVSAGAGYVFTLDREELP